MTDACVACGYQPSAIVAARWELFVELDAKSANQRLTNSGSTRWAYAADRDQWTRRLQVATANIGQHRLGPLRSATGFRRLTLMRHYDGRQREFDEANLVGGCKGLVDSVVRLGMLVDDSRKHAQIIYKQTKASPTGVMFVVEELETT